MVAQPRPLIEVLAEIPDFRSNQGKRHPLAAILALVCSALLCGYRSYTAMAEWGRNYGARLTHALGFTRQPPCAATLHTVLRGVDREALEANLGAWAEGLLAATPAAQDAAEGIAVDGKTLRGSQKQGAPGAHLLSALGHRLGLTLAQQAVADKTNEMPVVLELLRQVVLEGRVVTMDALLTQRQIAQQIVAAGGDYVMVVKANQPQLREDIATVFALPPIAAETRTVARRWTVATAASSSGGWRPVTYWWGTVTGRAWRKCSNWSGRSSAKRRGRCGRKWWRESPVWRRRVPTRRACWRWCGATGTSKTSRIGCVM